MTQKTESKWQTLRRFLEWYMQEDTTYRAGAIYEAYLNEGGSAELADVRGCCFSTGCILLEFQIEYHNLLLDYIADFSYKFKNAFLIKNFHRNIYIFCYSIFVIISKIVF